MKDLKKQIKAFEGKFKELETEKAELIVKYNKAMRLIDKLKKKAEDAKSSSHSHKYEQEE